MKQARAKSMPFLNLARRRRRMRRSTGFSMPLRDGAVIMGLSVGVEQRRIMCREQRTVEPNPMVHRMYGSIKTGKSKDRAVGVWEAESGGAQRGCAPRSMQLLAAHLLVVFLA